jgi:hypothetical protein
LSLDRYPSGAGLRHDVAHRGAERDVFPVTTPRPPDWYRFVLWHPAVAVTLAAPQTRAEFGDDLRVLYAGGPLPN